MLCAAALHPDKSSLYIPRMQGMRDKFVQAVIMQIVSTMQQEGLGDEDDEESEEAADALTESRNVDLIVEEQIVEMRRRLEQQQRKMSDYVTRLENLQLSYDELKYEKEKNDRQLETFRKATQDGVTSAKTIKMLEERVNEQMDIIASNEEDIEFHTKAKAQLETEVDKLSVKAALADELQDQNSELRYRNEELEKRANTADRYKQKLEGQQDLEKNYKILQFEHRALTEQLRDFQQESEKGAHTRKREEELTKMLTQSEQHLWDERNQRQQLARDLTAMEDDVFRLKARQQHDESLITELQEQLQSGAGNVSHRDASGVLNLEDELNDVAEEGGEGYRLKFSRLEAENKMLRKTMGSTGDAALLRRDVEDIKRQREGLQQGFNDMFEKYTLSQAQVEALSNGNVGEGYAVKVNCWGKDSTNTSLQHRGIQEITRRAHAARCRPGSSKQKDKRRRRTLGRQTAGAGTCQIPARRSGNKWLRCCS